MILLVLTAFCAPQLHRWVVGGVIVEIENDTGRKLELVQVILRGDSARLGPATDGASVAVTLRPTSAGPLLLRGASLADDSLLIPIYVDTRSLPGEGHVIVQLLPRHAYRVRRQTHDGAAVRDRVRPSPPPDSSEE